MGVCSRELLGVDGRGQHSVIINVDCGAKLVVYTRSSPLTWHILSKSSQLWLLSKLNLEGGVPVIVINDLWRIILAPVVDIQLYPLSIIRICEACHTSEGCLWAGGNLHSTSVSIIPTTTAIGHPRRLLIWDSFIFLFDKKSVIDLMSEVVDIFIRFNLRQEASIAKY